MEWSKGLLGDGSDDTDDYLSRGCLFDFRKQGLKCQIWRSGPDGYADCRYGDCEYSYFQTWKMVLQLIL